MLHFQVTFLLNKDILYFLYLHYGMRATTIMCRSKALCFICSCFSMAPYCSSEVDGHQWVRGQEEVVESQGVFEF